MPNIVYQPARPNPLNNIVGGIAGFQEERIRMEERDRQRQAFELDKQRAEFELATAKQEQARKIESEQAFRDGVQFSIKYAGKDQHAIAREEASTRAGIEGGRQGGPIGAMLGVAGIATKAQEDFNFHEKQKLEERQAIVSRMLPQHAEAFMQLDDIERREERIIFERDRLLGDLGQWLKNDPNIGGDEGSAAAVQQAMSQLQTLDPRDAGAAKAIDGVRQVLVKGILARAESETVGRQKARTFQQLGVTVKGLYDSGGLDDTGVAAIEYMQTGLEGLPVHTMEDWEKYKDKLDETVARQIDATVRRRNAARSMEKAAKNPAETVSRITEEETDLMAKEKALGMRSEAQGDPTPEELRARVLARAQREGVPADALRHLLPQPSTLDVARQKGLWPMKPGAQGPGAGRRAAQQETKPLSQAPKGSKERAYSLIAQLTIQGASREEMEAALAEKGIQIDQIDRNELSRQIGLLRGGERTRAEIGAK